MRLKKFQLSDYEVFVNLLYDFHCEVYEGRDIGEKYFYYKKVMSMIADKHDIILAIDDLDEVIGFTTGKVDHMEGLTEPVYNGDIAYVIPSRRKGRASYMLYKNLHMYAKERGYRLISSGKIDNGISEMIEKHFNATPKYILFEG